MYKVIKPYTTYFASNPITLPVGTILEYWEERGFYLSHAVDNFCVPVSKWAVEAWTEYFQKVEA